MTTETFENFNGVKHMPLRVFNRTVMFANIIKDFGNDAAKEYFEQFSDTDKKQMYIMQTYIKKFGVEFARKKATENWEPEESEEVVQAG